MVRRASSSVCGFKSDISKHQARGRRHLLRNTDRPKARSISSLRPLGSRSQLERPPLMADRGHKLFISWVEKFGRGASWSRGRGMAGDPKECREHAERCSELSRSLPDKGVRQTFAELAEFWLRLAAEFEDTQAFLDRLREISELAAPQPGNPIPHPRLSVASRGTKDAGRSRAWKPPSRPAAITKDAGRSRRPFVNDYVFS